jgi:putative peptidoglycan lipid II flippase
LALSLAGGVNTALLLGFLKKNPHIAVNKALHTAIRYALKLALFSIAAILPVLWLNPRLLGLFAGRSRLFAYGLPFAITALVYSVIGLLLLIAAKDTYIQTILRKATR